MRSASVQAETTSRGSGAIPVWKRIRSVRWDRGIPPVVSMVVLLVTSLCFAQTEDPCSGVKQRALILGGGGVKGAFEAGAIYHLVVQRGCDFSEFSGVSVGALNATFLAQARRSTDASESHANLAEQTEALVSLWQSIRTTSDFARRRPLAALRFGLFGLDSLVDFTPLRQLEDKEISSERLLEGRPVSVGVVSFGDGKYNEIQAAATVSPENRITFFDYLHGSSTPPVFGRLPRVPAGASPAEQTQLVDGSLRHMTPVDSYFVNCTPYARPELASGTAPRNCRPTADGLPAHGSIQQLFVIVTSPYSRKSDQLPLADPNCCRRGTRQITDGRKILGRTLEVMDDSVYRRDLDFLLSVNDFVYWRWQVYESTVLNAPPERQRETKHQFPGPDSFAFETYNRDPQSDPDAPSRPYRIGLVAPDREFADVRNILRISEKSTREQLYCGCMAANRMMETEFDLTSMADRCAKRFPRPTRAQRNLPRVPVAWDTGTCQSTGSSLQTAGASLDERETATR